MIAATTRNPMFPSMGSPGGIGGISCGGGGSGAAKQFAVANITISKVNKKFGTIFIGCKSK